MDNLVKLHRQKKAELCKGNKHNAAELCNLLGVEYQKIGKYEDALEEHHEEAELCIDLDDQNGIAVAHRRLGEVYSDMENWDKSLQHLQTYLSLAVSNKNIVEEQRAYATIGRAYLQKAGAGALESASEDLNEAEKAFIKSLSVCKQVTDSVDMKEYCQMQCRLYLNLGLVLEQKGNMLKAKELISESLRLCKKYSLHDDACRCHSVLAGILSREGSLKLAFKEAEESLFFAEKLNDKILIYEAFCLMAFIRLNDMDFNSSKKYYYKAYKVKSLSQEDMNIIKKNLKAVVKLCEASEEVSQHSDDAARVFLMYEKMGDAWAALECYRHAIESYQKVLDIGKEIHKSEKELAPIYLSLAQTYTDAKMYTEAKEYYLKEYEVHADENHTEACRTLLSIAVTCENLKESFDQVEIHYEEALKLATSLNDLKLEKHVISLYIDLVGISEEKLELLNKRKIEIETKIDSDSDDDGTIFSESDSGSLHLDMLDFSESDEETETSADFRKSGRSLFSFRRNEKGETLLHKACIDGNLKMVKKLLAQGHPVNPRDNSGWLPIHEASNYGYHEIVEILIESGAWINDRGGQYCEGITPVHDAASCGNVDVVYLLISKGASLLVRTDDGDTPLDCLTKYQLRTELDPDTEHAITALQQEMRSRMEQSGFNFPNSSECTKKIHSGKTPRKLQHFETNSMIVEKSTEESAGISTDEDHDDENSLSPTYHHSDMESATDTYIEAIACVSNPASRSRKSPEVKVTNKKSALIDASENVGDDWLIDDITISRKRKRPVEDSKFALCTSSKSERRETKKFRRLKQRELKVTSLERERNDSIISHVSHSSSSHLSDYSLDENYSSDKNNDSGVCVEPKSHGSSSKSYNSYISSVLQFRVMVQSHLLLVPLVEQNKEKNIRWLTEEVCKRYHHSFGIKPNLFLTTADGALLDLDDPVAVIASCNAESLIGVVTGWNLMPVAERYNEACKQLKGIYATSILELVKYSESVGVLDLSKAGSITLNHLKPVMKTIYCQQCLTTIDFSRCRLMDEGLTDLVNVLPTLTFLESVYLKCCCLTTSGLHTLVEAVKERKVLQVLRNFDISYNNFSSFSLMHFYDFLSLPLLTVISFQHCYLSWDRRLHISKKYCSIKRLNLDLNTIDPDVLSELLLCLPSLTVLTLSGLNSVKGTAIKNTGRLGTALASALGMGDNCHIEQLDVSLCQLNDADVKNVIVFLYRCSSLSYLNLSYNNRVTVLCLSDLLDELLKNPEPPINKLLLHTGFSDTKSLLNEFDLIKKLMASVHGNIREISLPCIAGSASPCADNLQDVLSNIYNVKTKGCSLFLYKK